MTLKLCQEPVDAKSCPSPHWKCERRIIQADSL